MSVSQMKSISKIISISFLIGMNYLFIILFILPYLNNIINCLIIIVFQIILLGYFFFMKFSNSGFREKNTDKNLLIKNIEKYNYHQICPTCYVF